MLNGKVCARPRPLPTVGGLVNDYATIYNPVADPGSACAVSSPDLAALTRAGGGGGISIPKLSSSTSEAKKIAELLAAAPVVRNACDLDLFVFLNRHPRSLLSTEQLAAFVGYPMTQIAESVEAFIAAGILDRTQNRAHAARLYHLKTREPEGEKLTRLLQSASTRQGRRSILKTLRTKRSVRKPGTAKTEGRLLRMA